MALAAVVAFHDGPSHLSRNGLDGHGGPSHLSRDGLDGLDGHDGHDSLSYVVVVQMGLQQSWPTLKISTITII